MRAFGIGSLLVVSFPKSSWALAPLVRDSLETKWRFRPGIDLAVIEPPSGTQEMQNPGKKPPGCAAKRLIFPGFRPSWIPVSRSSAKDSGPFGRPQIMCFVLEIERGCPLVRSSLEETRCFRSGIVLAVVDQSGKPECRKPGQVSTVYSPEHVLSWLSGSPGFQVPCFPE